MQLQLFPDDDLPPQAARLAPALQRLAREGVLIGTSSWKYEGWLGQIYSPERYMVRGKLSRKKFEAECLKEYASTFPTVCGDFSFYQFPAPAYWARLFAETPATFQYGFKVPEEITVATWPGHARYGGRAGQGNEHFLDAGLFRSAFADVLAPYAGRVATLIFEFGTFSHKAFAHPAEFVDRLDWFLGQLPPAFRYAVEIRNAEYLSPDYFAMLAARGVAHVFNAWTRMPTVADQIALPGAFTAEFTVIRALLRRGRSYEQAVKGFQPYERVQDPDPPTRAAMREVVDRARRVKKPAFLFVNNRLEGNAPGTIEAVIEGI